MAIISLGKINKKILFSIFGGLFKLLADYIVKYIKNEHKIEYRTHPFIIGINAGLGLCISFIPFLIFKRNYKFLYQNQITVNEQLIFNDSNDFFFAKSNKKHYSLLLFAFCDFTQKLLSFIYDSFDNFWIFDAPFILIFSYFILKTKLYIHHFVSLIFIIIFGIGINVIHFLDREKSSDFAFLILNTIVVEVIFSLEMVVAKYSMEYKFSSPYEICLVDGIFIFILNLILLIIFTFIPFSEIYYISKTEYEGKLYVDNIIQYFTKITFIEVVSFLVSMISRFGFTIFSLLTTKYFTPSHVVIILIIGEFFFPFQNDDPLWKILVQYGIYVLLIFVMFVFLEIIELNCFGLQKNTEKNIIHRAAEMVSRVETDEESLRDE